MILIYIYIYISNHVIRLLSKTLYILNHVIRLLSKTLNDDTKSDIKKNKLTCHIFIFLFQIYFIKKKGINALLVPTF